MFDWLKPRHKRKSYDPVGNWRDMGDWVKRMVQYEERLNPAGAVPVAHNVVQSKNGTLRKR